MKSEFQKFAFVGSLILALSAGIAAQTGSKAKTNPPATPQAKTSQPATHFTQGTITSINANQMVITKQVRGKAEQTTFAFNSQTQRSGNLAAGTRVSVQYREDNGQKIVAAVRELPAETSVKDPKATYKARSKS
jgi:hypothetical protein